MKTRLGIHLFNINHQYKTLYELKSTLPDDEAIIHIDFSENYGCKFAEEVQSIHFGASRSQVSLHTGVCYIGTEKPFPFCSLSSSLRHDPVAIWAHLQPVLQKIAPSTVVKTLHFISDGPTTQYRNKINFYLASTYPFDQGYKNVTWNFLEAGHGKGAPDGVGGTLKRVADRLVANGTDIINAEDLYEKLNTVTSIQLFLIKDSDIKKIEDQDIPNLTTVNGTMKIHQLIFDCKFEGMIKHRHVSCFCKGSKYQCDCFGIQSSYLIHKPITNHKIVSQSKKDLDGRESFSGTSGTLLVPITPDVSLLNKWCVVIYDKNPYPGIIVDFDESSFEVNCMSRIGKNRFFWPTVPDVIWYDCDVVLGLIPEPLPVTGRHVQIDKSYWDEICLKLDLD